MQAEILCVGTELLLGDTVNTNAAYISKKLADIGVFVYYHSVVGDNPARLKKSLALALSRADVVITTGGLGPTYDDLTKETIAEAMGLSLVPNPEALERMRAYFAKTNRKMSENNRKQAMLPENAVVMQNDYGTAPGAICEKEGKTVIMLPGPPREMKPMFERYAVPYLEKRSEIRLFSRNIRLYGIGESDAEARVAQLMKSSTNPTIAPYVKDGEVLLRVTASARDEKSAAPLLDQAEARLRSVFGGLVYGVDVDSLWRVAFDKLKAKGLTVSSAESCTGGLWGELLTSIPGSSAVYGCGVISYSNEIKTKLLGVPAGDIEKFGAVSETVAKKMAAGVRALSGSDIAVAITGIAGPDGGTPEKPVGTVFVAATDGRRELCRRLLIGHGAAERDYIRRLSCLAGFDLVIKLAD